MPTTPMGEALLQDQTSSKVANLGATIILTLERLGHVTGPEAALVAYGGPRALRRGRLFPVIEPTGAQLSAIRRALARLKAEDVVVAAGRQRRRKIYRLRRDYELLSSISLGTSDE